MPAAIRDAQIQTVDDKDIDYELASPNAFLGSHTNLIPIPSAVQGARLPYGARFFNQALPVEGAEAPLVQNLIDNDEQGRSFDDYFGEHAGALRADDDYEVQEVDNDYITLRRADGSTVKRSIYNRLPFNRKSFITHRPLVKPGQQLKKGDMLAASNFTDDKGTLAMGLNARVGVVPYKGYSMDDAIVVSDSFAKRLRSTTTETYGLALSDSIKPGRNHFRALFPDKFTKKQYENLDDDGVVKPGTILQPGDPLILATKPRVISSKSSDVGRLSRSMQSVRSDASQVWEGDSEAEVMDTAKTKNGFKVIVRETRPSEDADKIVFRSGQKGTISRIIPDEHMPRTLDGKPLEVLLNPLGMPSRANVSLLYELLLGKVAAAKGAPIKVPAFNKPGENWYDTVEKALAEAGLTDVEEVFDPLDNRKLENPITVGNGYIMKLQHTAKSKADARGQGSYDQNEQPAKGGEGGAKRISGLETHALLSSGAYATIREGATLRGQRNDNYWRLLREGNTPKEPGAPFVWHKFRALMTGAGLRMKDEDDGNIRLGAMTDRDVDRYGPVEIKNPGLINLKTLEPETGGLFDNSLVGGNKWGVIRLPEPVLNPAFEDVARHILGMKRKDLLAVMAGEMELPPELLSRLRSRRKSAAIVAEPSSIPTTGPAAIRAALETTDLDELERFHKAQIDSGKVSKRHASVQALNAIEGLRKNNTRPEELLITKVPVIPPAFRPFALAGETFIPGDANELYKDLFDMREAFKEARGVFGDNGVVDERKAFQGAVRAVYGYGEPVNPKSQQRGLSGFLKQVTGSSPKFSFFQRKLISKPQDQVARGVISPDPELKLDQIGLPEDMAWDMYSNYVLRRLVRGGMTRRAALEHKRDRSDFARKALLDEMAARPIVYSRSPAWHKYNIISADPVLIKGDAIKISPFVTTGLAGDFDGDAMNLHVPASAEAVEEARTILKPSRMLFSIKDPDRVVPALKHEQVLGPYAASQRPSRAVYQFPSKAMALDAIRRKKISLQDEVEYPDEEPFSGAAESVKQACAAVRRACCFS